MLPKKQQLDVDKKEGQQLGSKIKTFWYAVRLRPDSGSRTPVLCRVQWCKGRVRNREGCIWDTRNTVEPSGDVVGLNQ